MRDSMRLLWHSCIILILVFIVTPNQLMANNFVSDLSNMDPKARVDFIDETISNLKKTEPIEISKVYDLLKSCLAVKDTNNFFYTTKLIGNKYYPRRKLNEEGIIFLIKCQKMLGGEENALYDLNNSIGNHLAQLGFLLEAQECYFKSLEWYEKYNKVNTTTPLGNIANIYFKQANYKKALQYNLLALESSLNLKDKESKLYNIIFDYFRLALIHEKLDNQKKAKFYYSKSIKAAEELGEARLLLLSLAYSIGSKYNKLNKDYTIALIKKGEELVIKNDTHSFSNKEFFLMERSNFYLDNGQIDKVMKPKEIHSRKLIDKADKFSYLAAYYTATNNVDSVAHYYDELVKFNNQNIIETRKNAISNIEEKHNNRDLVEKNAEFKRAAEKSKWISSIIVLFLIIAAGFLILQYLNNKKHQYNNKLLKLKSNELAKSNKQLAKSNEELERFVFIASHDLKTPIVNIMNFSNLLEGRAEIHKDEQLNKYIGFVKKAGDRLNNIVISSLEFSRFSKVSETIEEEKIDLDFLFKEIEGCMADYLSNSNARIICVNKLGFIHGSYPSVFILLQNIIENGIKYNKSDIPTIYLESKENKDTLSIFIRDNGIGIDNAHLHKIFVMFTRLHKHSEYEGSGLGLSISKKIIEKLNGEIRVESTPGEGTTFEIIIPTKSTPTVKRKADVNKE